MTTIRRIVVATDFSPVSNAAVERAVQLAAAHEAALCLLHASEPRAADPAHPDPAHPDPAHPDPARRVADAAAVLARASGRAVDAHHAAGAPAAVIQRYVGAHAGSLVVVGSRADPALAGLGSTASMVVDAPAGPVLVVRALEVRPYETVLSAVDLREGAVRAAEFALALFPQARHHLLYALEAEPDTAAWTRAEGELEQLAQRLAAGAAHPVAAVVADDVPERAILVGAAELAAGCVVVGHHGHGPATVGALGSMAQHVVHSALSDVLVVP